MKIEALLYRPQRQQIWAVFRLRPDDLGRARFNVIRAKLGKQTKSEIWDASRPDWRLESLIRNRLTKGWQVLSPLDLERVYPDFLAALGDQDLELE